MRLWWDRGAPVLRPFAKAMTRGHDMDRQDKARAQRVLVIAL
jgi:hypothetical protein